jgi:hypothetical protein
MSEMAFIINKTLIAGTIFLRIGSLKKLAITPDSKINNINRKTEIAKLE